LSIDPSRIIQNKQNTLKSAAGDAVSLTSTFENSFPGLKVTSSDTSSKSLRVIDAAQSTVGDMTSAFSETFGNLSEQIPSQLPSLAEGIGTAFENTASSFRAQASEISDNISSLAQNGITGMANSAVANIENGIDNFFGDYIGDFSKIVLSPGQILSSIGVSGSKVGILTSAEPKPSPKFAQVKNQLRDYASFNCISSFGALKSQSLQNPKETFRKNGADYTILKSGGGGIVGENRIVTAFDQANSGNLEYFIDDISVDAIIAPNRRTGISTATKVEFKVHEPYSLGLFLQSLQAAAQATGHQNYLKAPYLLEMDFVGWDDKNNSTHAEYSSRKIPLMLTKIEFNVEQGGSVYEVQAIPWNESAFNDEVQNIDDNFEISGPSVAECLAIGENSLAAHLNTNEQRLSEAAGLTSSDLYVISFPSRLNEVNKQNQLDNDLEDFATVDIEQLRSILGSEVGQGQFSQAAQRRQRAGDTNAPSYAASRSVFENVVENAGNLFESLASSAVSDINQVGASPQIEDFNTGGDHPFGLGLYTYNTDTGIYQRNGIELRLSDTNRTYRFPQGTSILKIIEEIVLVSEYGKNSIQSDFDENGMFPWFKVESEVYEVSDYEFECAKGRKPRIYVYKVVPYDVNSSHAVAPNRSIPNAANLAGQAVKHYNYIYTGENENVLGFDIKFNAAFFEAIQSDRGNLSSDSVSGARNKPVNDDPDTEISEQTGPGELCNQEGHSIETQDQTRSNVVSPGEATPLINLARQFQDSLMNSNVDLITADLEIWGDPYFLPDAGMGNYTAARGPTITMNSDGVLDFQRNEIDIVLNFRTPIDYTNEGNMQFPGDVLGTKAVKGFSGLYQVIRASSTISGNQFKQTLKLIRRKNQSVEGTSNVRNLITNPASKMNQNSQQRAGQVGNGPDDGFRGGQLSSAGGTGPIVEEPASNNGKLVTLTTPSGKQFAVADVVAENFQGLVNELENDLGYEIRTIGGYADSKTSSGRYSYHASGLAIDINAAQNAMVSPRPGDAPEPTDMPADGTGSLMSALAAKHGLGWGGDWNSSTDAMHFTAAEYEGGTLDWPANGLIPGETIDTTDDARAARTNAPEPPLRTSAADARIRAGGTADSESSIVIAQSNAAAARINAGGTDKSNVSGTQPVSPEAAARINAGGTAFTGRPNPQTSSSDPSVLNVASLRPYRSLDPRDDRYDTKTGDKTVTAAQVDAALSSARTPLRDNTAGSAVTGTGATLSGNRGDGLRGSSTVRKTGTQQPTGSSAARTNNNTPLR
jgi:hypothetical protein